MRRAALISSRFSSAASSATTRSAPGLTKMDGEQRAQRKFLLLIGILANVGLLGYYKYTDFFIENFNLLTGSDYALKHIVLRSVFHFSPSS